MQSENKSPEEIGALIKDSLEKYPVDPSDPRNLELMSWGLMNSDMRAAWLSVVILGKRHSIDEDGAPHVDGRKCSLDPNLIRLCEHSLDRQQMEQYVKNCLSEASAIAYKDMTPEQVSDPSTAFVFYRTLLTLPLESHANSLYWAYKGEDV